MPEHTGAYPEADGGPCDDNAAKLQKVTPTKLAEAFRGAQYSAADGGPWGDNADSCKKPLPLNLLKPYEGFIL